MGFLVLGILALALALIFFGLYAMSGGSDCAVTAEECEAISRMLGFAALFFAGVSAFSIWRVFKHRRSAKAGDEAGDGRGRL
jgi:heme/copper-type cytochrome/quinol oxidase subunit 2